MLVVGNTNLVLVCETGVLMLSKHNFSSQMNIYLTLQFTLLSLYYYIMFIPVLYLYCGV